MEKESKIRLVAKQDIPHFAIKKGDIGGLIYNSGYPAYNNDDIIDTSSWMDITCDIEDSALRGDSLLMDNSDLNNTKLYNTQVINRSHVNYSSCYDSFITRSEINSITLTNSKIYNSTLDVAEDASDDGELTVVNSYIKNCFLQELPCSLKNVHLENIDTFEEQPVSEVDYDIFYHDAPYELKDFTYIAKHKECARLYVEKVPPELEDDDVILHKQTDGDWIICIIGVGES